MKILMVCMGNLCRSPMARVVAEHLAKQAGVGGDHTFDSAGTHASRYSEPMDPRGRAALTRRGYAVGKIKSRMITDKDFARFDFILAMDQSNMNALRQMCPGEHVSKLRLFLEFAPDAGSREIPDPYYGTEQGFERVLDLCEAGGQGLVQRLISGTVY